MQENIIGARIASFIVLSKYNKLMELSVNDMEDTDEFSTLVSDVTRLFKAELKEYSRVTPEEIDTYFKNYSLDNINNRLDMREKQKLTERKRILAGDPAINGVTISSIISGKLCLDTAIDVAETIDRYNEEGKLSDSEIYTLYSLFKRHKYFILTYNNFIEALALSDEFKVEKMSRMSFEDIEEGFNFKFIDNSQNIFYNYVIECIKQLENINSGDKCFDMFFEMQFVAKVKAIIPYLNMLSLTRLGYLLDEYRYGNNENKAIAKVKKLINNKREETNE